VNRRITTAVLLAWTVAICACATAAKPPDTDYCQRLQREIQGKKHGFLAGNVAYYTGGFHACWNLKEHEILDLPHPFYHDLRSRGVGLVASTGTGQDNTGLGNDLSGWEFYKDTRVLYGSVLIDGQNHRHPIPSKMFWRPDRMICEYEVGLLYLEGLAGIEYSVPDDTCRICDTMPTDWDWMELSVPIRKVGTTQTVWTGVRLERKTIGGQVIKSIRVSDSPLRVSIEPWLEERTLAGPAALRGCEAVVQPLPPPGHAGYTFAEGTPNPVSAEVTLGKDR